MTKNRPILKQFGQLKPEDFAAVPVWASCHFFDYDEPWYDDTDEETFRPWAGSLPVDPSEGMLLVRAAFRTARGREFSGFLTPAPFDAGQDLGLIQPHLAIGDRFFKFWGGMLGVPAAEKSAFYSALGAEPAQIFPIVFSCNAELASGVSSGSIAGFYRSTSLAEQVVEL
jgi:hypothetical protein